MKDLSLLVWLSQLGLSGAVPPAALSLLFVWLRNRFGWGTWAIWVGVGLGLYCAITGFIASLRTLSQLTKDKKEETTVVSFNDHQ